MPSKKKKYNSRFPPARIKKIMQTDEEVGKVAAAVPVIISRALELFVESLVMKASLITRSRNAKTLTTSHLKTCVLNDNSFQFLKDIVSSVPDVQGDDEQSPNPCTFDGNLSAGESVDLRMRQSKRSKDKGTSEDSAGPSHSTADESETWSAEEDGEDSEESSRESSSNHPVTSSLPSSAIPSQSFNFSLSASSSHHLPHTIQYTPNNSTALSAEEDYDS